MSSNDAFDIDEGKRVVVVIRRSGDFSWYRSDVDLWIMDINKLNDAFAGFGIASPEALPDERVGIPVVDETTAADFLSRMQKHEVSKDDLANELVTLTPYTTSWWDVAEIFPIMFVDFDNRCVFACYGDQTPVERYIPDGWTGEFADFITDRDGRQLPIAERFWVRDGVDLLERFV